MNETSDNGDALYSAFLLQIQNYVIFYWTLVVLNTGFLTNICVVIVFFRKKFKNNPMAAHNRFIALTGNISIILQYVSVFPQAYGLNLKATSTFACIFISYMSRVFTQMISWLHVMMSLDRMISVLSPALHLRVKSTRFARITAAIIFISLCALNSINFCFKVTTTTTNSSASSNATLAKCVSSPKITEIRDMFHIIMRTFLPLSFMLVANSVLIVSLFKQKRNLNLDRSMRKEISFSVSVLVQNLLFIVFTVPQAFSVMYQYYSEFAESEAASIRFLAVINLGMTCANELATYTICCSFLVNLIFNKLFREELLSLFHTWGSKFAPNYVPKSRNSSSDRAAPAY